MKRIVFFIRFVLAGWSASAVTRSWTNSAGGNWFVAANWSPNGLPGSSDSVTITNDGTYTVLVPTGAVATATITIGGGSGTQTLLYGTSSGQLALTNSTVLANGVLQVTNSGLQGALLVRPGGQLQLDAVSLFFYSFSLTNQGTVTWSNGALAIGGSNSDTTQITNSGTWLITGNNNMNYGGGGRSIFANGGTFRKLTGTGTATIGMDLINSPAASVEVLSGTLQFSALQTNVLGGSFMATAPGTINFFGANCVDAGGTASGSGTIQFNNGNLILRTNIVPGLKLAGGEIYIIGTNTFQQAGAITNLTLDGAQLHGTNRIAGTMTLNAGSLPDKLTVQPGGQLFLATTGSKLLYTLNLINQGTVTWSGGGLNVGSTPPTIISNGGTWLITSDGAMSYGGGNTPSFTNYGTVHKTAGTGTSSFSGVAFVNQTSGIIEVDTGTLQMPNNYTNTAGTLWLNGGTLTASGTLGMTGGSLIGTGTNLASSIFDGGTVSPGQSPGLIQFKNGLTLGSNSTLVIEGTGTIPGTQYDQLSVSGAIALNNCALQVTSLPSVPIGTTFIIISNNSGSAISGTFNSLPENSLLTVSGQPFRIHYSGSGNSVRLVRDSGTGPQLSSGSYSNGTFRLSGAGGNAVIYTIQATTNFIQWTNLGTATGDGSGNFIFIDPNAFLFRYRFYRTTN